jgi:imidazolonepropionase-like amidohydrolase
MALAIACVTACACRAPAPGSRDSPETLYIENARVFDGERVLPRATVSIAGGRVLEVAENMLVPDDASRLNAAGQTLLPGFIDSHVHVRKISELEQALVFGTTTVLDMCDDPEIAGALRRAATREDRIADLRFAGRAVTAPGGHGSRCGPRAPTVRGPSEVEPFVAARVAEGSDYIKIIIEDGTAAGYPMPSLGRESARAAIASAHHHGKLAVVHVTLASNARQAIEDGADGLAHLFMDRAPDPDFASVVAAHHAFVMPTLSVLLSGTGVSPGAALARDPAIAGELSAEALSRLHGHRPERAGSGLRYAFAEQTVQLLREHGVALLAGSDAPNPGTWFGVTLHGELERLVGAGLTPIEALAAATSRPADRFALADRGRIAPGKRADLLLVSGDPTNDIRATRNVVAIFRSGARLDREAVRARAREGGPRLPLRIQRGAVY